MLIHDIARIGVNCSLVSIAAKVPGNMRDSQQGKKTLSGHSGVGGVRHQIATRCQGVALCYPGVGG